MIQDLEQMLHPDLSMIWKGCIYLRTLGQEKFIYEGGSQICNNLVGHSRGGDRNFGIYLGGNRPQMTLWMLTFNDRYPLLPSRHNPSNPLFKSLEILKIHVVFKLCSIICL